jgi:hypothetical protein
MIQAYVQELRPKRKMVYKSWKRPQTILPGKWEQRSENKLYLRFSAISLFVFRILDMQFVHKPPNRQANKEMESIFVTIKQVNASLCCVKCNT